MDAVNKVLIAYAELVTVQQKAYAIDKLVQDKQARLSELLSKLSDEQMNEYLLIVNVQ